MAAPRRVVDIPIGEADLARLEAIAQSRTEPASWVERARILLAYRANSSAQAVGETIGLTHHTVLRCLDRAVRLGVMAPSTTARAPASHLRSPPTPKGGWYPWPARKPKDPGYPHELWTTRLLARHARGPAVAAGHPSMAAIVQGTVCKILSRNEVKPHKVRYYLERRDAAFETKMAEVLCVHREVAVLRASEAAASNVAIISYDEKSGLQAIGNTAPDLPPKPAAHSAFARDHECQRHAEPARRDRPADRQDACLCRGSPSVARVRQLPQAARCRLSHRYGDQTDPRQPFRPYFERNQGRVANQPEGRFALVFTPKHGNTARGSISWKAASPGWRGLCSVTSASHPRPN
jgi:hypothetical protein